MKTISFTIPLYFLLVFTTCTSVAQVLYSPQIRIELHADSVEKLVGSEVQGHYGANSYLTKFSAQTVDYQGKTKEVILCKEGIIVHPIDKGVNCCIHFVMENQVLAHILIQYKNLSLAEVKQILINENRYNLGGNFFFERGYRFYSKIIVADDGTVCADYRPTVFNELPLSIQEQLKMLNMKFN